MTTTTVQKPLYDRIMSMWVARTVQTDEGIFKTFNKNYLAHAEEQANKFLQRSLPQDLVGTVERKDDVPEGYGFFKCTAEGNQIIFGYEPYFTVMLGDEEDRIAPLFRLGFIPATVESTRQIIAATASQFFLSIGGRDDKLEPEISGVRGSNTENGIRILTPYWGGRTLDAVGDGRYVIGNQMALRSCYVPNEGEELKPLSRIRVLDRVLKVEKPEQELNRLLKKYEHNKDVQRIIELTKGKSKK